MATRTPVENRMTSSPPRTIRLLLLVVLALAVSTTAALGAPTNSQIRAKRAEAQAARAQIAQLGEELEPAIERWNQAQAELAEVQADIALNEQRITLVRGNLQSSRDILAEKLVQDYKYGDTDTLAAILSSGSIGGMLDAADLLERSQTQVAELLQNLRADQGELAEREEAAREVGGPRGGAGGADAGREGAHRRRARADARSWRPASRARSRSSEQEELERQRRIAAEAARLLEVQRRLHGAGRARRTRRRRSAAPRPTISGGTSGGTSGGSSGGSSGGGSTENIPAPPPTDGSLGARAVAVAMQYLGVPYVWGGASPGGFDCSGLVMYAYGQVGVGLPHFTGALWNSGRRVSQSELIPGDLVFFYPDVHHVGIYIGGGQFIHAPVDRRRREDLLARRPRRQLLRRRPALLAARGRSRREGAGATTLTCRDQQHAAVAPQGQQPGDARPRRGDRHGAGRLVHRDPGAAGDPARVRRRDRVGRVGHHVVQPRARAGGGARRADRPPPPAGGLRGRPPGLRRRLAGLRARTVVRACSSPPAACRRSAVRPWSAPRWSSCRGPRAPRRRAVAAWATAGALGAAIGPALGGALTEAISWQAIFIAQTPAALLAIPVLRGPSPTPDAGDRPPGGPASGPTSPSASSRPR